jgi:hypothetical protein
VCCETGCCHGRENAQATIAIILPFFKVATK